jgi:hypothetical protein
MRKLKFYRLCQWLLLLYILTFSLSFCPYQKNGQAMPGYPLTRCSFSNPEIKRLSLLANSSTLLISFLTLSLYDPVRQWSTSLLAPLLTLLTSPLSNVLPWLQSTFTRRTSGHCLETIIAPSPLNVMSLCPPSSSCSLPHSYSKGLTDVFLNKALK